jgi:ribose/xylose/arabinose/galactoside ABC-type transport system permease subunit
LGYLFLTFTRAGRDIYAVGGNEDAALTSGVNVDSRKILAFIISAVCAGIAGLVLTSRIAVGQPTLGEGYEFKSITAAIIGGTSLYGGAGTASGTALGVILVAVIGNGLNLLRVSSFVQLVINGLIIILAVGLDVWQKRSKQ